MKYRKSLLLLVFAAALVFARGTWEWQNPLPQGDDLMDIFCFSPDKTIAVGVNGLILMTEDGGQTWQAIPSGTREFLRSIFFVNDQTGWIAGGNNTILFTEDDGFTWSPQEPFLIGPFDPMNPVPPQIINYNLYAIHFIDENTGWAVGTKTDFFTFQTSGGIVHTTDGGETWTDQESGTDQWLFDVAAVNSNKLFAVGGSYNEAVLLETTNGGAKWNKRAGMPGYDGSLSVELRGIEFPDANHGWIVGGADLTLATVNGGSTWTPVDWSSLGQYTLPDRVFFVNKNIGWILGTTILHTDNGGNTWECQYGPEFSSSFYAIHSPDGLNAVMAGPAGILAQTADGGEHWNRVSRSAALDDLHDVQFLDAGRGYACGDNGVILKTGDGGEEWMLLPFAEVDYFFHDCFFLDRNNGWVGGGGYSGNAWKGQLYHTPDGGATWVKKSGDWSGTVTSVCFVSADTGWVVGESAMIRRTTDGGSTWTVQTNPYSGTTQQFEAVYFVDHNRGCIVAGYEGKILCTVNGGTTWTDAVTHTDAWLYDISFTDANNGWACGYGVIVHTSDGGLTWNPQTLPEQNLDLNSIHFSDALNGIALGKDAVRTLDGGLTWVLDDPNVYAEFQAVWMAGKDQFWGVGDNGMIMHWYSGEDANSRPMITSAAEDQAVEGEPYSYTATALDPDGDEITFTYIIYPDWLTANEAVLSGTPPAGNETATFMVTVSDGQEADTLTVTLTIEEAPNSVEGDALLPREMVLYPNHPNPFNPETMIRFGLPEKTHVRLFIYNTAGQCVARMDRGILEPGYHAAEWQASGFPSGVYTIRLETNGKVLTRKALLLK